MFWRSAAPCQEVSLTYKPGTTRSQLREVKNKKLLCESLTCGELFDYSNPNVDYSNLCQFMHLQKHKFYTVCIDPDSAALKCIDFLKGCAAKGYINFISVVEYAIPQPDDQMVYGNHYIIVCDKNSEIKWLLKSLRAGRPVYSIRSDPCVVLKNYMYETQDKLECVLHKLSTDNLRDTIELGRFVRPSSRIEISNEQFDKQEFNLRVGELAKDLIRVIRHHLNLIPGYETVTTIIDATDMLNAAILCISRISRELAVATEPLYIATIMTNLNEQLIKFISCYYNYLHDVHNGSKKTVSHVVMYDILDLLNQRMSIQRISQEPIVNVETTFLNSRRDQVNAEAKIIWTTKGVTTHKPVSFAVCKNTFTLIRQPQQATATMQLKQLTSDKCEATVVAVSQQPRIVNVELSFCNNRKDQVNAEAMGILSTKGLTTHKTVNFAVCKNTLTLIRQQQEAKATMLLIQLTSDKCEATVVAVSQQPRIPWSSCLTLPAKPQITIMVIGRSNQNNSNFINMVTSGKAHDGIVNYGSYNMKLVSVVPDTTPLDLSMHQTIHGFIFVMENRMSTMPFIAEKDLRSLLEIVPRSAARNCCIINCFTPNASLTLAEASNQLSKFIDAFCKVHELNDCISHFCIDKSAVLNHQEHELPDDASNLIKSKIEDFILPVTHSPVSRSELKTVECLKKLGDILNRKQIQNDGNIDRLLASIADRTMSDTALYFRKHLKTALPLTDNEWKTAVNWEMDDDLMEIVREIGSYLKAEESSALEILKSKSIFDMLADSDEQTTHVVANFTGRDSANVVDELTPTTNSNLTQGNKSNAQSVTQTSTTLPSKNVMIVGTSPPNKQMLLKHVNCVRQHENFDDAVNNAALITFQDSEAYVMDYGPHSIRYISRDELGMEEFDIHGCIIVVESNTMELSISTDNHIRKTFSRFPRRAVENCCIVNTFTPSKTFGMKDAEQQMRDLVTKFCEQHALTNRPSFVCVDTTVMDAILNHNVPESSSVCQSAYAASKRGIEQFLQTIQTAQPITPGDLEISANWTRLCEAFRLHFKDRSPETLRLMATIAENCLTGFSIYCRKNKGDILPLRDDEWPAALCYWSPKDDKVAALLQKLNSR